LREHESQVVEAGGRIVAVGLGGMEYACAFRDDAGIGFPLLVDERGVAYKAVELRRGTLFQIFSPSNFAARRRAQQAGVRQHKVGKDPFQLGGSFVFGPGNVDVFSHVSENFGDNAPVDQLIRTLAEFTRSA